MIINYIYEYNIITSGNEKEQEVRTATQSDFDNF